MKKKLLSIFTAVFVLANLLNLAIIQPTRADEASDKQALALIAQCHGVKVDGSIFTAECGPYRNCIDNMIVNTELCKSVRKLDSAALTLDKTSLGKCTQQHHTQEKCYANFGECLQSHLSSGKVSNADAKACAATTAKGDFPDSDNPENDKKSSCVIEGIGWILCPVLTLMSKLSDNAYKVVASMLVTSPLMTTGDTKGVYQAWSIMRNFANVAFVVAFLVIIFSQVSSIGITNYGIKKMLPRLVVAAVLVNISYWICAIAIDVSNILGASLGDLFSSIEGSVKTEDAGSFSGGGGWENITGSIVAGVVGAAVLYVSLSALVPALVTVLFTIILVFLALALRQALIILAVVVAPLAFVAYLLPNTESWFSKWRSLFQGLLIIYPTIALLFGASALASTIIMHSANGPYKVVIQIMGGVVAVAPLVFIPKMIQTGSNAIARFSNAMNGKTKSLQDRARGGAAGYMKNRKTLNQTKALNNGKYRPGQSFIRARAKRQAVIASREATLKDATARFISREAQLGETPGDNTFARQMAGGGYFSKGSDQVRAAVIAGAITQEKKQLMEDVSNMEALVRIKFKNNPEEALAQALKSGDELQALAAQNILFKSGSGGITRFRNTVQNAEKAAASATAAGDSQPQENLSAVAGFLKQNIQEQHGKYVKEKGADVTSWANAKPDENGKTPTLTESAAGDLNDNELAGQHSGSLAKMAQQGKISKEQATSVLNDKRVSANLDETKRTILENAAGYTSSEIENKHAGQIDKAHEQANQLNIKHDQDAAYRTYEDNGNIRR